MGERRLLGMILDTRATDHKNVGRPRRFIKSLWCKLLTRNREAIQFDEAPPGDVKRHPLSEPVILWYQENAHDSVHSTFGVDGYHILEGLMVQTAHNRLQEKSL
jgi:hypothetical protein